MKHWKGGIAIIGTVLVSSGGAAAYGAAIPVCMIVGGATLIIIAIICAIESGE